MIEFWLDAQLSRGLTRWINQNFSVCSARAVWDLGLAQATDSRIYDAAAAAGAVVVSKDRDFVRLWRERQPQARIVLLACGNVSNVRLREILASALPEVVERLDSGETFVEVAGETTQAPASTSLPPASSSNPPAPAG